VRFDHKRPGKNNKNVCTSSEKSQVLKSVLGVENMLRAAYKKWDSRLFKKWFGVSTKNDNANVKYRYKRAMEMMFNKERLWRIMCCGEGAGNECSSCNKRNS
jgi:hypothetical protein